MTKADKTVRQVEGRWHKGTATQQQQADPRVVNPGAEENAQVLELVAQALAVGVRRSVRVDYPVQLVLGVMDPVWFAAPVTFKRATGHVGVVHVSIMGADKHVELTAKSAPNKKWTAGTILPNATPKRPSHNIEYGPRMPSSNISF